MLRDSGTTGQIFTTLGGDLHKKEELLSCRDHPYYEKFKDADCSDALFKEMTACEAITNYEELYTGFTKSLRRFRDSFDTLGLMLCMSRDVNAIRYGIENGLITKEMVNDYGDSPLHLAALSGSQLAVAYMIDTWQLNPEKIEAATKANALHYAAMSNDTALLDYLIYTVKMPLNSKNIVGHNALDYACTAGALNAVEYLYKSGLRPHLDKITHLIFAGPNALAVFDKLKCLESAKPDRTIEDLPNFTPCVLI